MNIYKLEIKMATKSLVSYTISMMAMFTIFLFFFDSFKEGAELIDTLLKNFPKEFKAAFGFSDVNLAQFNGYASFLFSYIVLIGAVFGMKVGISALSEEARAKTSDFLISKPVTRTYIVTAKIAAVLSLIVIQNIVVTSYTFLLSILTINENFDYKLFFYMNISVFLVQLFFVGVGLLISVLIGKIKNVMPITLGVVFMFFIIELVNESLMDAKLKYLTPFSYFKGSDILLTNGLELKFLLLDIFVFITCLLISYVLYNKKDVAAV